MQGKIIKRPRVVIAVGFVGIVIASLFLSIPWSAVNERALTQPAIVTSAITGFTSNLAANPSSISPRNRDGINDEVTFSFMAAEPGQFNITVQEDIRCVDLRSRFVAVAGNATRLLMLNAVNTRTAADRIDYQVLARFSDDQGMTWSQPASTNLSDYDYLSHYGVTHSYLDLACNESEHSYILGTVAQNVPWVYELSFYKSFDGITWTFLNKSSLLTSMFDTNINFDMTLSNNGTEILVTATRSQGMNAYAYFLKLLDGGRVVQHLLLNYSTSLGYLAPAIAVSTSGKIVCTWYVQWGGYNTFVLTSSTDDGSIWSPRVSLNTRGIPSDWTLAFIESRSFQMAFDPSGRLDALLIRNRTSITAMSSLDDGLHWENWTVLRAYAPLAYVYSLHYARLADGNTTIAFTSALAGNRLDSGIMAYASSYFLRPRLVFSAEDRWLTSMHDTTITWNGTDMSGGFARDGPYMARVWIENTSHYVNPWPSEAKVLVDNTLPDISLAVSNPYFSPDSPTSPGIKDTTDLTLQSSKEGVYDIFIDGTVQERPESRVTTNDALEYHADVAMDANSRLWCVYTSFEDQRKNLYLKTSDDNGLTFSPSVNLVESSDYDDGAAIAIHGDNMFVVFSRLMTSPVSNNYYTDIYILKSYDLGKTWRAPEMLTYGLPTSHLHPLNLNPDLIITGNGTIFVSYFHRDDNGNQRIEIIKSTDDAYTFSTPSTIWSPPIVASWSYERPTSLAFDETSQTLFALVQGLGTYTGTYNITATLFNSSTWGATWTNRSMAMFGNETFYTRGLTLDIMPDGTMQSIAYGIVVNASLHYLRSTDHGFTWTWTASRDLGMHTEAEYSLYPMHCEIRSGRSPRGDVFYVYNKVPASTGNKDVYFFAVTATEKRFHGTITTIGIKTETWNGVNMWGNRCGTGNYTVVARVVDEANNPRVVTRVCIIDNEAPAILAALPPIQDLVPSASQIVSVRNGSMFVDYNVTLHYRFNQTGVYTANDTLFTGGYFSGMIPASPTLEVYFYFNATDLAGNSVILGPWYYFKPSPVVVVSSSEGDPARPLDGRITIEVQGLPVAQLSRVQVAYSFDQWQTNDTIILVLDLDSLSYKATINGSQQRGRLDYQVYITRQGHATIEAAGDAGSTTQEAIPAFPVITIEYPWNVYVAIISAAFGLFLGIMQAHGKRSSVKRIQARFMHMLESYTKTEDMGRATGTKLSKAIAKARKERARMEGAKRLARGRFMYTVLTLGTGATIAGALYSDYVSGNGGVAMLASALGLLFSSLAFMERVNIDASDALYIDRRASNFMAFLHVLLIMLVLAVFMISAPLVDWFNYYVVKQSFDIGPIRIPRLYLSLVMPVVTSIALILFTSYGDLKNSVKRLELARVSGENWKFIWQQKEETVSKLASNVSLKIFIFLVTISFAVISTTQVGRYTEQGMLVLLPFIIAWLGVFLVNALASAGRSTVKEALKAWLIEKTKQCPACKATNLFESQFCTACGNAFAGQTSIIEKSTECKSCKDRSPEGSKYCRACGTAF